MIGKTAKFFSNAWMFFLAAAVFASAQEPAATGRLVIAVGSCCKLVRPEERAPVFNTIADLKPDVMLWLGDNWYYHTADLKEVRGKKNGDLIRGDWSDESSMLARAEFVHHHPDLQRILAEVPGYATWDDHDFGYNNCPLGDPEELTDDEVTRVFAGREAALRVFAKMWPRQSHGTDELPGAFCSFRRGPVAFFLMDDRYYKDARRNRIWGAGQLDWLKRGLLEAEKSGAPVKIIGNGCQVLATTRKESFNAEAPGELDELLSFVRTNGIRNVIFLSGDRHRSELWVKSVGGQQFVELTASPFFHNMTRVDPEDYPTRVWVGQPVNNFGLVSVDIPEAGKGVVDFEVFDEQGQPLENIGPTLHPKGTRCHGRFDLSRGRLSD